MEEVLVNTEKKLNHLMPKKLKASAIHLAISSVVFLVILYFILFQWYPFPFFNTDGGWQGIRLIIAVDLVLGPLLTLIIFNPSKKIREKIFDLSCIALVQCIVLGWGVYTVYNQRPVVISHWQGTFYSVGRESLSVQEIDLSKLASLSHETPAMVNATSDKEVNDIATSLLLGLNHSLPEAAHFHLFRPLKNSMDELSEYAMDILAVAKKEPIVNSELQRLQKINDMQIGDSLFMPFEGRYGKAILIFDKNGDYLGYMNRSN